jgi:hypothetical protein
VNGGQQVFNIQNQLTDLVCAICFANRGNFVTVKLFGYAFASMFYLGIVQADEAVGSSAFRNFAVTIGICSTSLLRILLILQPKLQISGSSV